MAQLDNEVVKDQLEDLHDALDVLQGTLRPLNLTQEESTVYSYCVDEQLDAIAKAKMFITIGYAIDSLLFCCLNITGVSTETHTIMNELQRIKDYVGKIKEATAHEKRKTLLDKKAAGRMIDHDLSRNAALDRERAIQTAQTNQRIEAKLASLAASNIGKHTRFQNSGIMQEASEHLPTAKKQASARDVQHDLDSAELGAVNTNESAYNSPSPGLLTHSDEQVTRSIASAKHVDSIDSSMFQETKAERKARERRERKTAKKLRQTQAKAKQTAKANHLAS